MPANIESMCYFGEVPWHGLGNPLNGEESLDEVQRLAGLDWSVNVEPLYRKINGEFVEYSLGRASVRSSDGSDLGNVGPRWTPYQNSDMFRCFEPLVQNGLMKWHTAGSLSDGQRVWCLCQLNLDNSVIRPGDEIRKFAMISNGHDGKLAVRFGFTPIRIVCANTLSLAHNSKASKLIRVRHSRLVVENVEKLRDIMNLANQEFETTADNFRFLASRDINQSDLQKYVKLVFGAKPDEELSTRQENINKRVEELFETGRGNDVAGRTWWAAYNAVTEYVNWEQGRTNDTRMNAVWFGQGENMIKDALTIAMALAA